jgi:hypothetical protein
VTRNRTPDVAARPNTFDSVRKALVRARPGDRIVLLDQQYEERLILDGDHDELPRDVTIESAKETLWQLPAGETENVPLIQLTQVAGLRFRGIAFDAQLQSDHLISVTGRCPGLQLENLSLRGFRRAALLLTGCAGDRDAPVTFQRLRTTAAIRQDADAALWFAGPTAPTAPPISQYLRVTDCRLEGPLKTAVRLDASAVSVDFSRNRFFRCTEGFRIGSAATPIRLQLTLTANTFCDVQTALDLAGLGTSPDSRLVARNNLFARTPTLVHAGKAFATAQLQSLFTDCASNVSDQESGRAEAGLVQVKRLTFDLPTDREADRRFLRYPRTSELATAGANGEPVGVPPE